MNKKSITLTILIVIAIMLIIALIGNIVCTEKSLDKIIYNAKVEAEETLISSGKITYTKDIGDSSTHSLSNANLPENTPENPQNIGTIVAPKDNWNIETVTAISIGNGQTVPVPIGFYYVGGDLDTGVIISDEKEDKYDGITDKTTWEYTRKLKGNQFVWIPCTEEEYKKCEVWNGITQKPSGTTLTDGTLCNSGWDKTTYTSELPQIRKYGGFYVARYEAGLAKTITEFTSTQKYTALNQVYNLEGIPQTKAGVIPWMFINWETSQKNAKNMYNTNSISSGLITGTQWDVMLKQMVERTELTEDDLTNSERWGNYGDNSIEYKGRMATVVIISNKWYMTAFKGETEGKTHNGKLDRELLTTGASRQTEKYHIFDVAGNLGEWTDEVSLYKGKNGKEINTQYRIFRGGTFQWKDETDNDKAVCYRYGLCDESIVDADIGFRVVLYIK